MTLDDPRRPETRHIKGLTGDGPEGGDPDILATRDHDIIREWARLNDAEPATGEESPSGPASTVKIVDGGSGLRFNFPAMSPFRGISWDEWFEHFHRHDLTFVYDDPADHHPPSARYRLVPTAEVRV
jgi:hypothetical protein